MANASSNESISKERPGLALETETLPGVGVSKALGCCYNVLPSQCSCTHSSGALDKDGQNNSSRGSPQGWKTTPYILGNEVTERIASFGMTWSLILYLTQEFHMSKVSASYVLTITVGIIGLAPLLGGIISDAYLGRYRTLLCGSVSNLVGMVWLSLTAILPALRPAPCFSEGSGPKLCPPASKTQLAFLFSAFIFLAIGSGGTRPCSYPFGADQFEQTTIEQKKQLLTFFNTYYFALTMGMLLSVTVIAYVQLDVSWALGFGLPAVLMAIAIFVFLIGSSKYIYVTPTGSPFTDVAKVLVAAYRKRNLALPSDPSELYSGQHQGTGGQSCDEGQLMLAHTDQFQCLDKAAVIREETAQGDMEGGRRDTEGSWRLCEVHKVEQVKCVARVLPIWLSGIMASTNLAEQSIFVTLQAQAMDRHLIRGSSFQIPPSSVAVVAFLGLLIWLPIYDRALVPLARKFSRDPVRGISLFQRIASGYLLGLLSLLLAGVVESRRRSSSSDTSVYWLFPQLAIFGIADAFWIIGLIEFFYDHMPPRMRSVAGALFSCTIALGSFLGAILLAIAQAVTGKSGHRPWIAETLSQGHLDYFYYLLAVLMGLDCLYFFVCAHNYKPSRLQQERGQTGLSKSDLGTGSAISENSSTKADRHAVTKNSMLQANKEETEVL